MQVRPLFDAHCHVVSAAELRASVLVSRMALMSSNEQDWGVVRELARLDRQRVVAGVGVHPWFAHAAREGWLERMERVLQEDREAFVGEIGLDKVATTPDTGRTEWEAQVHVFEAQMRLAARMGRAVSVHCVQAHGAMMETVRRLAAEQALPPRVCMHSWGGSSEMATAYCKLKDVGDRFFFSFSATINGRRPKTVSVVAAVPPDRLLVESDHERDIDEHVGRAVALVAHAMGWSEEETAQRTAANAYILFP